MKTQNARNARRETGWPSVPLGGAFFTRIVPHIFALYRETEFFLKRLKSNPLARQDRPQWPYYSSVTGTGGNLSGCDKLSRFRFNPRMSVAIRFVLLSLLLSPAFVRAEDPLPQVERLQSSPVLRHLKKNDLGHAPSNPAEHTLAQMYLPPGFKAEAVVSEPDIHQPVAMAFDERGRIWVAEAYSYPVRQPEVQGLDKLVIFEDTDGDGKFETRKVFAEGLNLVSGFEVGFGGVWVGAAPYLLFIADKNRDDKPDGEPQILLDGFGYQDTHECLNSFMWGPDGWLYGNQGVFNYAQIGKPGTPALDANSNDFVSSTNASNNDARARPSPSRGEGRVRGSTATPASSASKPTAASRRVELRAGVWRYHPV